MNNRKIGKEFEIKAKQYLLDKFDEVIWLSENKSSSFDFKVIKDNKEYFIDAKYTSDGNKPLLHYTQKNVDFVVFGTKDKIILYDKSDIIKKCCISKQDMSSITISKKLAQRLNTWKYSLGVKSVEQVLDRILKIIPASELENFK